MFRTRFRTRARFIPAVSGGGGGYSITNSLRFNDNDPAYLSRTPATAGNRKTWTWSGWVKRGNLETLKTLFAASNESTTQAYILFNSVDKISFLDYATATNINLKTSAVLRDTSGWYHIVVVFNTTQATGSDRVKLYINGSEQTVTYLTTPSLNYEGAINTAVAHGIGREEYNNTSYFDGYLAEINFIDGQALTADDFGEIDADTGEWSPIAYSGTYGTNGFYLPFDGNANDDSGNGNNWTENNLASTDYMLDTPTNNFSVFNPLALGLDATLSEGNLEVAYGSSATRTATMATIGVSSGKWYWEITSNIDGGEINGITNSSNYTGIYPGHTAGGWGYYGGNGDKYIEGSASSYGDSYTTGDVIGFALDMDVGTLVAYKNDVSQGTMVSGLTGSIFPAMGDGTQAGATNNTVNFGADSSFAGNKTRQGNTDANGIGDFYYEPPAGYLAVCTENLPAPAIEQPETQFNVVTYTGNGTSQAITGVGFQPDFVWIKQRNSTASHQLQDSVRGVGKILFSNGTLAEQSFNTITSFDSDGFTVAVDGVATGTNSSGNTFVAWCWKAGGTAVTNTDGSITSQVSANVDAGFSIVSYTGTGSPESFGHGLSKRPDFVIVKNRDSTSPWLTKHFEVMTDDKNYLDLNDTAPVQTAGSTTFILSTSNNSVVSYGTSGRVSDDSNDYIAYCFHSVEGFSKFGSYVGNGSTNGPFVYTGFKPAFVMVKRTDSTSNWTIIDNEREGYNVDNDPLYPNLSNAEGTADLFDILSNGFKLRSTSTSINASGGTYIYMAFAEHPFKEALAR